MPHPHSLTALRWSIFGSTFFLFLIVFKGGGGYLDLQEYLDDAQRLWLKGDLRIPDIGGGFHYNRYVLGLPFVSGPLVWLGHGLALLSSAVNERSVTALAVPILGAFAAVLMFDWGLLLGVSPRSALSSVGVFALGSPMLTYTRFYFTEVLVVAAVLLTLVAFLRARNARAENDWRRLFLSGMGLALMPAGHNAMLTTLACFSLVMAGTLWREIQRPVLTRLARIAILALPPCLYVAIFLGMNFYRYGSPFKTGYHAIRPEEVNTYMMLKYIPGNLSYLGEWMLHTPWLILSLLALVPLWRKDRPLSVIVWSGILAQTFFWLCYRFLYFTTSRYLLTLFILYALGLPLLVQFIISRWPQRGLLYGGLSVLLYGVCNFMGGDGAQAFSFDPNSGKLLFLTWYMTPSLEKSYGTPAGLWQVVTLLTLAALAGGFWIVAWRKMQLFSLSPQFPQLGERVG